MPRPFRWDVRRREQLGRLVDEDGPLPPYLAELRRCSARIVAHAGDADLLFVGRSPENIFDYLSGVFSGTSHELRLGLLNISLRFDDINALDRQQVTAFREHALTLGFDPATIHAAPRPTALVDVVASGGTLGKLVDLLLDWARDQGIDPRAVRRRLRFVGLTMMKHTSPNTWRWQQHSEWARRFPPSAIKNVSVDHGVFCFIANTQPKVAASNPPPQWAAPLLSRPTHTPEQLDALKLARALFERGLDADERKQFCAQLVDEPAMRQSWCRALVGELRRGSR